MSSKKYQVNLSRPKLEEPAHKMPVEAENKDDVRFSPNLNGAATPRPDNDDDDDKDDACNICNFSFLEIISNYVNNFLQNIFYRVGRFTGTYPWAGILIGLAIFALPLVGFSRFYEENEDRNLWVPEGARSLKDQDRAKVWFPENLRILQVIVEAPDVLTPDVLQKAFELHTKITGIKVTVGDTEYTWEELCIKMGDNCFMSSVLEVWGWDTTVINNDVTFTESKIKADVKNTKISPVTNKQLDVSLVLSGDNINSDGEYESSPAMLMNYYLRTTKPEDETEKEVLEFEQKFLDVCDEGVESLQIYYFAVRSFADIGGGAISDDLQFLAIGYILVIIYLTLALGKFNCRDHKVSMAVCGILCIGMSVGFSIGLSSLFGLFYGPVHSVLPFLLLGIGVDDMFVFVAGWDNLSPDEKLLPLNEKIAIVCKHAGVSILITSLTDFAAFGIGGITIIPALRSFCLYASMGILGIFLITLFFFVGVFTYDQKRAAANRNALICCYKHDNDYQPNKCSEQSLSAKVFDQYIAKVLSLLPVKIVVITVTLGLAATGCYGFSQIEQDFQYEWFIPKGNYLYDQIQKSKEYFPEDGYDGWVYFGEIDYHSRYDDLLGLPGNLEALDGITDGSVSFWLTDFKAWLLANSADSDINSRSTSGKPNSLSDLEFLAEKYIIQSGEGEAFQQDVNFKDAGTDNTITSSRLTFKYKKTPNSEIGINSMVESRELVDGMNFGKTKAFIYSDRMISWEGDKVIKEELIRNIMVAFAIVFIVCLLLIANIATVLLVLSCVMFTLVNVVGFVHFWGSTINVVSTINLVLAIGLAVDYAAHIGHTFMISAGSRKTRVRTSLREMGAAVFNGGFSTFLAFFPLCLSVSFVFTTFFKVFFLVSLFGLFHGLIYLPVALSWLGPSPYNSVTQQEGQQHKQNMPSAVNPVVENGKPAV